MVKSPWYGQDVRKPAGKPVARVVEFSERVKRVFHGFSCVLSYTQDFSYRNFPASAAPFTIALLLAYGKTYGKVSLGGIRNNYHCYGFHRIGFLSN